MNAEALEIFFDGRTLAQQLFERVQRELKSSDRCGIGRYDGKIMPCIVGAKDIDVWVSLSEQHPRGLRRREFLGVVDRRATLADLEAMLYGG